MDTTFICPACIEPTQKTFACREMKSLTEFLRSKNQKFINGADVTIAIPGPIFSEQNQTKRAMYNYMDHAEVGSETGEDRRGLVMEEA